jgi:transcriptional regulator with XRE-family HTH domain
MSRRPTSADVAHRAGVSRATVSYVLNNVAHQSISDATRQRVRAAAAELDYTPHVAAQTLRAGESKLVLFINTGVPYGTNLSTMVAALASDVAASGRSLVLWQQQDPNDLAATLSHLQPVLAIALGELNGVQRALLARSPGRGWPRPGAPVSGWAWNRRRSPNSPRCTRSRSESWVTCWGSGRGVAIRLRPLLATTTWSPPRA